jgi:hypothetical protein
VGSLKGIQYVAWQHVGNICRLNGKVSKGYICMYKITPPSQVFPLINEGSNSPIKNTIQAHKSPQSYNQGGMKFTAITIALITVVSALSHPERHHKRGVCDCAGKPCIPDDFPFCCSSNKLARCIVENDDVGPVVQVRTCPLSCGTNDDEDPDCVRDE